MHVEFRNGIPQDIRTMLLMTLVGSITHINEERYKIDGYDPNTRHFRARRAQADDTVIPDTATESIHIGDIRHLVVGDTRPSR